jgi:hypothetical protein
MPPSQSLERKPQCNVKLPGKTIVGPVIVVSLVKLAAILLYKVRRSISDQREAQDRPDQTALGGPASRSTEPNVET